MYTDGSVYTGTTGCGACSAILYSPAADAAILYDSRAVGKMVSSSECEVGGILLGMETALKYLDQQSTASSNNTVHIFCDSASAIEAVYNLDSC